MIIILFRILLHYWIGSICYHHQFHVTLNPFKETIQLNFSSSTSLAQILDATPSHNNYSQIPSAELFQSKWKPPDRVSTEPEPLHPTTLPILALFAHSSPPPRVITRYIQKLCKASHSIDFLSPGGAGVATRWNQFRRKPERRLFY